MNSKNKTKSYSKASCNIHQRILKRVDYFINFVIRVIFRQLEERRAILKWGWHGMARSGASCLRVVIGTVIVFTEARTGR